MALFGMKHSFAFSVCARLLAVSVFYLVGWIPTADACTTAIVSGKYTSDGRPLLFKQRDTPDLENKLIAFKDGKYAYIGVVNTRDSLGKAVFGGYNSAGFVIMNSASYNLNVNDSVPDRGNDGVLMKLALQNCATLADFENLLDSLPKPLGTSSNFGVIDGRGGAAYYETSNVTYVKFDANDPQVAPLGYLIRTNFSYSGARSLDKGLARYGAANDLFYRASMSHSVSVDFLINDVSRSLKHGITNVDLYHQIPDAGSDPVYYPFRDFIPRYLTASAIVVQGVKSNESPLLTTMWTILGSPLTTVVVPVWITPGLELPRVLVADRSGKAKLNVYSLLLKNELFPIERGEGSDYINLAALFSADGQGILQRIISIEKKIVANAIDYQKRWQQNGAVAPGEAAQLYKWIDGVVDQSYVDNFAVSEVH